MYVERGAASRHRALLHLHTHARAPPLAGKNKSAKRPLFAVCANRIVALLLLLCYGGTQWHGSRVMHVNWMGIGMAFHLCAAAAAKVCKLQETMRCDCRPSCRFTNYYYYTSSTHQKVRVVGCGAANGRRSILPGRGSAMVIFFYLSPFISASTTLALNTAGQGRQIESAHGHGHGQPTAALPRGSHT